MRLSRWTSRLVDRARGCRRQSLSARRVGVNVVFREYGLRSRNYILDGDVIPGLRANGSSDVPRLGGVRLHELETG